MGVPPASVGIRGTNIEEEWFFRILGKKGFGIFCHYHGASRISGNGLVKLVYAFRGHVVLAATSGAIAAMGKVYGETDEISVAVEFVITVLVAIVSVRVVMQAGQNDRSTG